MDENEIVQIRINDILPNRFQPRIKFNDQAINELANSIKKFGMLQPIIVRRIGDKYEIVAGERRYKASMMAGLETIPAIVRDLDDQNSAEVALIENVQRRDLTPIEEAVSYKKILDMGYLNQEELADRLSKTQSAISNKLRLLNLDEEVQEALLDNKISERHARSLLKLEDYAMQRVLLNKIINERLTVKRTDQEIEELLNYDNEDEGGTIMKDEETKEIFNVPSVSIVDDIEIFDDFIEVDDVSILPSSYLDVDEIEKTAEQINVEKPLADMDLLLQSDNDEESEVVEQVVTEGKYFDFITSVNDNIDKQITDLNNEEDVLSTDYNDDLLEEEILPEYNFNLSNDQEEIKTDLKDDDSFRVTLDNYTFDNTDYTQFENLSVEENKKPFSDLIQDIRTYSKQIENYGYYIDVDEVDFGDYYEVIFKISKNGN